MEIIFELLFGVVGEFVLQLFGELLVEFGIDGFAEVFGRRERRNPVLASVGYATLGCVLGALSLLVFPRSFVRSETFHGVSLVLTPLLAGAAMSGLSLLRRRKGGPAFRLGTFAYAAAFAFGMAWVRFAFTA